MRRWDQTGQPRKITPMEDRELPQMEENVSSKKNVYLIFVPLSG